MIANKPDSSTDTSNKNSQQLLQDRKKHQQQTPNKSTRNLNPTSPKKSPSTFLIAFPYFFSPEIHSKLLIIRGGQLLMCTVNEDVIVDDGGNGGTDERPGPVDPVVGP